ncbi:MAG: arginine repressor [Thermoanaerobaculales bacterium]|nr:arginine repressor [Thermoanaerobaculales bacterium]
MRIVMLMPRDRSTIRRILIRQLLADREISSQGELARLLGEAGHRVTQSTVSRDLAELGTKADEGTERERYVLGDHDRPLDSGLDELRRALEDYLEGAVPSGNLVVLKVRSATAGAVAAALDANPPKGVVGTLAGDDTVVVIADDAVGGGTVAKTIMGILEE